MSASQARAAPRLEALADDAWLLHFGPGTVPGQAPVRENPDLRTNLRVHALCARLRAGPAWVRDVVPAYASLALFFDPEHVAADAAAAWLLQQATDASAATVTPHAARLVEIPVQYGGDAGPDLQSSAEELGMTPDELVRRHAAGEYTVAMIGFAPGFPYLLGMDPALAMPRLATPRPRVPAGSVGIGGAQTGVTLPRT